MDGSPKAKVEIHEETATELGNLLQDNIVAATKALRMVEVGLASYRNEVERQYAEIHRLQDRVADLESAAGRALTDFQFINSSPMWHGHPFNFRVEELSDLLGKPRPLSQEDAEWERLLDTMEDDEPKGE